MNTTTFAVKNTRTGNIFVGNSMTDPKFTPTIIRRKKVFSKGVWKIEVEEKPQIAEYPNEEAANQVAIALWGMKKMNCEVIPAKSVWRTVNV